MNQGRPSALAIPVVWIAATLSGAAALAYEICWSRALVVPLGNSTDAAAIVLAGFMLGIATGAWLGGRVAERVPSPLRLYALLELLLAAYALIAPPLLSLVSGVPAALGARYGAALALITLPCLLMGATLPLLVRALTGPDAPLRRQIGVLYGANTVGAAAGACATGFWGIALLGLQSSSTLAAAGSATAAVLALLVSFSRRRLGAVDPVQDAGAQPRARGLARLALAAAFVSGLSMLACELLWARMLTFVFGHDGYAFASLLVIVLLGLGVGGFVHRGLHRRDPARLVATLLGLFAVAALLSFWMAAEVVITFGRDPLHLSSFGPLATSVRLELYRELIYTPILVLAPSVLAGALFPAACSLYGRHAPDTGRAVGVVLLVNGVGSALGALIVAFGLVAVVGIQGGFVVVAVLSATVASAVLLHGRRPRGGGGIAIGAAPLFAAAAVALLLPAHLPRAMVREAVGARHQTFLYYEEARTGTVSVISNRINGEKQLVMNAVNEVTTRLVHDQSFKVLGHLAPLLHPEPRTGLMICLGAGLSAGATLTHPLERLDVVDLSAAVARAARHFASENNGVLDDPRFVLHVDDGRQFLLNSPGGYDVAIIDSTHPKAVDSWILYTREFYALLRERLAPGGIAVQWVPLHGLSEREFKIIVRTFQSAFPDMTLWANVGMETYGQVGYAKLVGTREGRLIIDYRALARRLRQPAIRDDLAPFGVDSPEELLDLFLAEADAVREWTEGLPVQTDDHPLVPYTTRFSNGRRMVPSLLLAVRSPLASLRGVAQSDVKIRLELERAYRIQGYVLANRLDRAAALHPDGSKVRLYLAQARTTLAYYQALAKLYADDPDKLFEAATQLAQLGHPTEARPLFDRALSLRPGDFRIRLNHALLLASLGDAPRAIAALSRLRDDRPKSALVHFNLGTTVLATGDAGAAATHLSAALDWDPGHLGARLGLADAYLALGELDRAEATLAPVLQQHPWVAAAHDQQGLIEAGRRHHAQAAAHHSRAVRLQPYLASYRYNLGVALQASGATDEAAAEYREALRSNPAHARASNNLGLIDAARGRFELAADRYLEALEAEPGYAAAAFNLGLALRGQQRSAEAVDAFCLALRLNRDLSDAQLQLAELGRDATQCGQ